MSLNRNILNLAIPAILTNITIPVLGLIDFAIAGHLSNDIFIGAIAIGTMMFNLVYWNFSFLRMGTTGMTAQYYGRKDSQMITITLYRALAIAVLLGILLWILQVPLSKLAMLLLSPSENIESWALKYFKICIWGAPFFLITLSIKGWLLGVQNAKIPMIIALSINILNIILSLIFVFVFDLGFIGIALGTLCAEIMGMMLATTLLLINYKQYIVRIPFALVAKGSGLGKFFKVNRDIFFRSLFLLTTNLTFTAIGARASDITLAVNALIMQLFLFYSYFMDGFAFAGEAIVGKYKGAENYFMLRKAIRYLFTWGTGVGLLFAMIYGLGLYPISSILANSDTIVNGMIDNRIWVILIPLAGVTAFIWDGVFIGLTSTKQMLVSTFCATSCFFAIYFIGNESFSNIRLWSAFISFLFIRGAVLTAFYFLKHKKKRSF